jgi:hypothetical protein
MREYQAHAGDQPASRRRHFRHRPLARLPWRPVHRRPRRRQHQGKGLALTTTEAKPAVTVPRTRCSHSSKACNYAGPRPASCLGDKTLELAPRHSRGVSIDPGRRSPPARRVRGHLAVSDRIQVLHPGLLHRIVQVLGCLPGLQALKGDALPAEQHAQALVADVVDHPLGNQELRQLRQAPGQNGKSCPDGLDLAIFLISRRSPRVNALLRRAGTAGSQLFGRLVALLQIGEPKPRSPAQLPFSPMGSMP